MATREAAVSCRRRNSSIEMLRFAFMFLIVVLHAYGHGSHLDYEAIYALGAEPSTALHLCIFSLGKIGVTGFMFISGYYGIRMNGKKWATMLAMMAFYYVVLTIAGGNFGLGSVVHLARVFDMWWFMAAYLFICLLSPFIEEGIKRLSQRKFLMMVLGMMYYTYVSHFIGMCNDHDVPLLLTVYLAARYINNYPPLFLKYVKAILFVSVLLLCIVPVVISMVGLPEKLNTLFISNNNVLLLTTVASLTVWLERKHTYIPWVNYLSSSVVAIYLITDFTWVRKLLDPWLLHHIMGWYGFVYVLLVCAGCLMVDKPREWVFKMIEKGYGKEK